VTEASRVVSLFREDEIRFRRRGLFEAAVVTQRRADIIEATGDLYPKCVSYMDRGEATGPDCYVIDDLFFVPSSNGAAVIAFTRDRAVRLMMMLIGYTGVSPSDLRRIAGLLAAIDADRDRAEQDEAAP